MYDCEAPSFDNLRKKKDTILLENNKRDPTRKTELIDSKIEAILKNDDNNYSLKKLQPARYDISKSNPVIGQTAEVADRPTAMRLNQSAAHEAKPLGAFTRKSNVSAL